MPELSMPEVRLKDKLPEGLREMRIDDIQKALPDVRLPRIDLGREARNAGKAAERAGRGAEKAAAKAARQADKAARSAQKAAAKEAAKAARTIGEALPLPRRKRGPNPVPIAVMFMIGGLVVGWILANNPVTGPRISAWLDDLRIRWDEWRGRGADTDDEWDAQPQAYPESLRAPIASEPYSDTAAGAEAGFGTGTSELPEGMGTSDPARVGADDRI